METVPHMRKLVLAGGIAVLATLGTGTAYAGGCNQSSSSAVQQYVEQVPGACGSKATNSNSKPRKVPQALQHKIDSQGGKDAALITKIVSNPGYGAPKTKLKVKAKVKAKVQAKGKIAKAQAKTKKILSDSATRKSNPVAASFSVITGGSDGRLLALIGLMAAVAAIVIFSALRRRRFTR